MGRDVGVGLGAGSLNVRQTRRSQARRQHAAEAEALERANAVANEGAPRAIGGTLRRLRTQRGLSLERLSAKSGVSRAMLSQIELGQSVPTINSVWKIAQALELPFSALLNDEQKPTSKILRLTEARQLTSHDGTFSSRPLFPPSATGARKLVEFYELRLAPGATENAEAHLPGTQENLVVVEGTVEISAEGQQHALGPGDAIIFNADRPHVYRNTGSQPAVMYLVMKYAPQP